MLVNVWFACTAGGCTYDTRPGGGKALLANLTGRRDARWRIDGRLHVGVQGARARALNDANRLATLMHGLRTSGRCMRIHDKKRSVDAMYELK